MSLRSTSGLPFICILALSTCMAPAPASAWASVEDESAAWTISTFGTASLVRAEGEGVTFLPFGTQPSGARQAWKSDIDSLLGIQARYSVANHGSATVQLTSKRDASNNYRPDVEWAYLSLEPGHGLTLRGGRFVAPLFAASDTRLIGYANLWVRPPVDVYTLGMSHVDGADLIWRTSWRDSTALFQLWGGRSRQAFPRSSASGLLTNQAVEYEGMAGINLSVQHQGLSLRFAHLRAQQTLITTQGRPEQGLRTFGASQSACVGKEALARTTLLCRDLYLGFSELEARYDVDHAPFQFTSIGLNSEWGAWRLIGESIWLQHQSRIANSRAGYFTLARSLASITPYLTFSWHRASTKAFSVQVRPEYAQLVKPTLKLYKPAGEEGPQQKTWSLGLRWDARSGWALKAQVDRIRPQGMGNGISELNRIGLVGKNLSRGPAIHIYNLSADFAY